MVMVGGPVTTTQGPRSPADTMFDPFWQLANDAGITVCYHGGETAYTKYLRDWGESDFKDLRNFDYTPAQCQAVMRDNGLFLATRRPA
jgi:hypothetical protein